MLKLYENIKLRRKELNMSQQELAERVGYKGKSMISQIENGAVDLPESMIMKFSEALQINPWLLMGKEEPEKEESFTQDENDYIQLDEKTKNFLDLYLNSSPDAQRAAETVLRTLLQNP